MPADNAGINNSGKGNAKQPLRGAVRRGGRRHHRHGFSPRYTDRPSPPRPGAPPRTPASGAGVGRTVFVAEKSGVPGPPGYLTEPAVMPATRNRCSSRKPTTIGTLTVSDAAMIWFQ